MKKIMSLITILALTFQLFAVSTFATTSNTSLFTSVNEVYGVYVTGDNHTALDVYSAKNVEFMFRDYTTTKFYKDTDPDSKVVTMKYSLSKDKRYVTATVTYFDRAVGKYVFKKDGSGKVYVEYKYNDGTSSKFPKIYASVDLATKYVKGNEFKATLNLESQLVDLIHESQDYQQSLRTVFEDGDAISETNFIEGIYSDESGEDVLDIGMTYIFDTKTYKNFENCLDAELTIGNEYYHIIGTDFTVDAKKGEMTITDADKNRMIVTASDRSTITHVTIIVDGETIFDEDIDYLLEQNYSS